MSTARPHLALACLALAFCSLTACTGHEPKPALPLTAALSTAPSTKPPESYGAPLGTAPAIELSRLLADPKQAPNHPVQVEGMVRQACTRRGCWFELATALAQSAPGCRVVLKDHAFFVPLDSAGSQVRVEGQVDVNTVPAAQVAHMESEGGHFANKNADGSALELRIVASGVQLRRMR